MIKKTTVNDPITYEGQPDGGRTPMIDPYNGCQLNCPYCFQLSEKNWNKNIYINTNIADLLLERLKLWEKTKTIYLGSRCDPYMDIEKKYGLTRKCLSALNELQINTMITTKSDNDIIFRDIDIIKNFKAKLTVLMGIANINQIGKGVNNKNILTANKLYEMGISVWVFITPVLPYIMDTEKIISAINSDIPIYLDKLRITANTVQAEKMTKLINRHYPEYIEQYSNIINENNEDYYNVLINQYKNNERINILF